uniref:Uncharacterized protein LOC112826322 n=1 Tax=Callorhinus ursinus TaxID=34884 RepID=A0A3Q7P8W2_CALUR|nr:uncharacterized protein LOC112826322 [Callorhinus ursinus]
MSHKGVRGPAVPRAAARGRWVRVGPCRTRQPPPLRFPAAAARRPAAPRPEHGGDAGAPPLLCVPPAPPPNPAQRGGGSATAVPVARGPRPKPGTIGGGAQSPPCPPPSPPRSPPRRNMAAQPPLPPSRAGPPAPRSLPAGGRKRLHAATEASPGLLRGPRPGKLRAPPGDCPRGLTKPTRSGGGAQAAPRRAPAPSAHPHAHKVWGPASSRPRHAARQRAGTSWARPLPARGLPHVPLPPPLCSGGALTLAPGRNFPFPGTPRPACTPRPGGGAGLARPLPEGPLCAPRAHPPARAGPGRVRAGPGRGRRAHAAPSHPPFPGPALPLRQPASEGAASRGCHTPGRPTARDPPRPPATPPPPRCPGPFRPTRPPSLRTGAAHNRFHSLGGGAGRLTRRSSRHHLRLARRGLSLPPPHPPPLYYDRRPQAGGAAGRPARPAKGLREEREPWLRGGGRPHPLGLARGREVARRRRSGGDGSTSKGHVGE